MSQIIDQLTIVRICLVFTVLRTEASVTLSLIVTCGLGLSPSPTYASSAPSDMTLKLWGLRHLRHKKGNTVVSTQRVTRQIKMESILKACNNAWIMGNAL